MMIGTWGSNGRTAMHHDAKELATRYGWLGQSNISESAYWGLADQWVRFLHCHHGNGGDDDNDDGDGDGDEYTNLCLSSLLPALSIHILLTFHLPSPFSFLPYLTIPLL